MFPVTWMEKKKSKLHLPQWPSSHVSPLSNWHPTLVGASQGKPPPRPRPSCPPPALALDIPLPQSSLTNGSSLKIQPSCPLLREAFSDLPQMDGLAAPSLSHSAPGESGSVRCLASRCGLWTNSTATPWVLRRNADSHFTPNLQNRNLHLNKLSRWPVDLLQLERLWASRI